MVKMSKELSWGYKRFNFFTTQIHKQNEKREYFGLWTRADGHTEKLVFTSQTNVDNVNVSYVNKTSNHFLLIIGRPTIYTHTKNFKVYAFGCDSIHVILFMRAFEGLAGAGNGNASASASASAIAIAPMPHDDASGIPRASASPPRSPCGGRAALALCRHT